MLRLPWKFSELQLCNWHWRNASSLKKKRKPRVYFNSKWRISDSWKGALTGWPFQTNWLKAITPICRNSQPVKNTVSFLVGNYPFWTMAKECGMVVDSWSIQFLVVRAEPMIHFSKNSVQQETWKKNLVEDSQWIALVNLDKDHL